MSTSPPPTSSKPVTRAPDSGSSTSTASTVASPTPSAGAHSPPRIVSTCRSPSTSTVVSTFEPYISRVTVRPPSYSKPIASVTSGRPCASATAGA